ncbi:hypothetical protein MGAST_29615 [Mycobacterium gastri 'Wayne']|uniref:Transposase n=1 Tax=Mycobacterium gastri TaxID=1777 RepID=A0A1X1VEP3_MYCGS
MKTDLDALLTELSVTIDDHVVHPDRRRARRPKQSTDAGAGAPGRDSGAALSARSEHPWPQMCYGRLGHLLPYLPKQPGYHKPVKAATPLLARPRCTWPPSGLSWADDLGLIDGTPVPCDAPRETAKRFELAGFANYGYCAAHCRWFWGVKLYLITTADGRPVAWCLADPKNGEREVAAEPFAHTRDLGALREKMIALTDKGLPSTELQRHCADPLNVPLVRPDRKDEKQRRYGNLAGMRPQTQAVYDTYKHQHNLERHGGPTLHGGHVRVAQRLLALAAAI